ncbi:extracellular solute-binding protein [Jiangella aurantiaca]|uniref:Extracellular solute-binding protein n=1 Tax=Jiangella aurantiaca TaxID=2530373 RepID=A0A4R5A2G2_9ACTN|nr:extracellular solute-binding protein [Jiangella aurantiaca]TDD65150.1 extracellular solute-binding protein [Jiangella aurantiaca]
MQRRTRVIAGALTAAGLLAVTACGGDDDPSTGGGEGADGGRGDITIWYSNNEAEVAWGEQMVEAWNAEHPDEQIEAQEIPAGASSEEVIGAAITAGNAPCLIFNTAPVAVPDFERQGGLVSLSSFDDGDSYIQERSGDVAEQYQSENGEYFQLPWKSNPVMIFYNKDMFAAAGLDPENPPLSTYDEFLETARTLVSSGAAPQAIWPAPTSEFFQSWFDFYPLYAAETGGTPLIEEGEATFADDAGTGVAEFWKTLYDEGLASREAYQGDSFADGQAAMAIVGPWAIAVYGENVNWGAVPVPTSAGTPAEETYTFSDAKNIGLYTSCENQATAWDVLKFATSEEQDGLLLEMTGQMPIRQDLPGTYPDYFAANPAYEVFGDQAGRTVEVPNVNNSVAIWQAFRDAWSQSVIFGEGDLQESLQGAADEIDGLAGQS